MARGEDAGHDDAADRLNRYWDAVVRPTAVHPGGRPPNPAEAETDLAFAVSQFHRLDDAPAPEARFAARLWRSLVAPGPNAADAEREAPPLPVGRGRRPLGVVHPVARRRVLVELVAAAAIALALLGGALDGRGLFPSLRGVSPTAAAQGTEATVASPQTCAGVPTPGPAMAAHDTERGSPHTLASAAPAPTGVACGEAGS